jgi:hypothetical protein
MGPGEVGCVVELELAPIETYLRGVVEDLGRVYEPGADLRGRCPESVVCCTSDPIGPGNRGSC